MREPETERRDRSSLLASRRGFMRAAAAGAIGAAGAGAAGAGTAVAQTDADGEIRLAGRAPGWVGRAPASIEETENPTLQLRAGEQYALTWENADGERHNFVIEDESGSVLERTDFTESEGETETLTFTATEEMATYRCQVHPQSMVGDVSVGDQSGTGVRLPVPTEPTLATTLTGAEEVPPVGTSAVGVAAFAETSEGGLSFALSALDIEDATQAHVHEAPAGENGSIVADLVRYADNVDGSDEGEPRNGSALEPLVAEGTVDDADLVERILERPEAFYVNVHTVENPPGEIRGQLEAVGADGGNGGGGGDGSGDDGDGGGSNGSGGGSDGGGGY